MSGLIVSLLPFLKMGRGRGWRWKAQYRPTRIFWLIVASLLGLTPKLSASINSLPPELLHAIFELFVFSDHITLSSCMRVCKRWHDIARLHFFAVVPSGSHHCGHLFQLLSADPGLAAYVKHVRFMRGCKFHPPPEREAPFDIGTLAWALPAFSFLNLRYVSLAWYNNLIHPLLSECSAQSPRTPVHSLQQLTLDNCVGVTRVLLDLFSLFSVRTLVIRINSVDLAPSRWNPGSSSHFRRSTPLASIAIQDLVLDVPMSPHDAEDYYRFFEYILIPGSLRALGIIAWSREDVPKLGRFLRSSAAQGIRSISIALSPFRLGYTDGGIPSFSLSSALGAVLAHCARLECFRIGFLGYTGCPSDPLFHRETFEPIIASLPQTLRAFAIDVQVTLWQCWKHFREAAVSLDAIDRLLAPSGAGRGGRFPDLQRVELRILESARGLPEDNKPIEEPRPSALPRLKAAGLLQVTNVHTHTRRADAHPPLELELQ